MSAKTKLKKSSKVTKETRNSSSTGGAPNVDFNLDNILGELPQPGFNQENHVVSESVGGREVKNRKMPASILPPEDHARILKNYTEVSKASWLQIPVETYVRYVDKNNMLHQGGRLKCFSRSVSGASTLMELIKYNHANRKRIVIKIDLDKTASIWRINDNKVKKPTTTVKSNVQGGAGGINGVASVNDQQTLLDPDEQFEMDSNAITDAKPMSREDDVLHKLGNKLLFEEGDMLKQKVENLESEVFRLNEETKKIFILVKRLYRMLEKPIA